MRYAPSPPRWALLLLCSLVAGSSAFHAPRSVVARVLRATDEAAPRPPTSHAAPKTEINRRRNLAIISHPDSGKTTMTEKLLLYGGALQTAGAVRMKGEQRGTKSDFMEMERERGISIR